MSKNQNIKNYTPPSHQKRVGMIGFLQDKNLQEKFFEGYKRNYEEGFQKVLKELNVHPNLFTDMRKSLNTGLIDEKKKNVERFDKLRNELKITHDKKFMDRIRKEIKDYDYSVSKLYRKTGDNGLTGNKLKRLEKEYGFHSELKELQLKYRKKQFDKYIKSSFKKYKTYKKLGISFKISVKLSGFGNPYGLKFMDYLIDYPEILDEIEGHQKSKGHGKKSLETMKITLKEKQSELNKLKKFKRELLKKHGKIKLNDKTSYHVRVTESHIYYPPQPETEYYQLEQGINDLKKHLSRIKRSILTSTLNKLKKKKEKNKLVHKTNQKENKYQSLSNDKSFQNLLIKHLNENLEFGYLNKKEPIFNYHKVMEGFEYNGDVFSIRTIHRILPLNKPFERKIESIKSKKKELFEKRIRMTYLEFVKECRYNFEEVRKRRFELEGTIYYRCLQDKKLKLEVNKLKSDFIDKEYTKWWKESKKRFFDFIKEGFTYNDSLVLSGIQQSYTKTRGKFYDLMNEDPEFNKRFMKIVVDVRSNVNMGLVTQEKLDKQKKYIEKLQEFKDQLIKDHPEKFEGTTDLDFIYQYGLKSNTKGSNKHSSPPPVYIFYLRRQIDVVIHHNITSQLNRLEKRFNENEKRKINYLKRLPKEWREQVRNVSRKGKNFLDVNGDVIFKYCPQCNTIKQSKDFSTRGKSGLQTWCTKCLLEVNIKKGKRLGRPGEFYKGKRIKIFNELNQVVSRRCTSCKDFKPVKDFNYPQRRGSVCVECYVDLPNNVITRKGEFRTINGVQVRMREFDQNTFQLIKKRCSRCKDLKPKEEFGRSKESKIDGLSTRCKECVKIVSNESYHRRN